MSRALIEIQKISKSFYSGDIETQAVVDASISIEKGEYVSFTGPSGCGKSTILSIIGLLDTPDLGSYYFQGVDVTTWRQKHKARIRNEQIGFVFQAFNLIADLTVEENVALPLVYRKGLPISKSKELTQIALERLGIAHRGHYFPGQLSGGQQQRVAIARAIVGNPDLILADEPTGNLDSKNAEQVMSIFNELNQAGTTICIVTHDPRSAGYAGRSIELFDGRIVADQLNEG